MTQQLLLTVPQAAERLSLGRSKVYELIGTGDLRVVRIGRAVRLLVADLEAYVAALAGEGDRHAHE